jgi:3-hydroxybutyryl-CoA dehydratase
MTSPHLLSAAPAPRTIGPISQTDIVRFAGAGGDFNPLHHDPTAARAAGFDDPIAMGQFTAGLLAAWVTDWCGIENLRRFEVKFTAPLRIGDTAELRGELEESGPAGWHLDLVVARGADILVRGTAVVARPPESANDR